MGPIRLTLRSTPTFYGLLSARIWVIEFNGAIDNLQLQWDQLTAEETKGYQILAEERAKHQIEEIEEEARQNTFQQALKQRAD